MAQCLSVNLWAVNQLWWQESGKRWAEEEQTKTKGGCQSAGKRSTRWVEKEKHYETAEKTHTHTGVPKKSKTQGRTLETQQEKHIKPIISSVKHSDTLTMVWLCLNTSYCKLFQRNFATNKPTIATVLLNTQKQSCTHTPLSSAGCAFTKYISLLVVLSVCECTAGVGSKSDSLLSPQRVFHSPQQRELWQTMFQTVCSWLGFASSASRLHSWCISHFTRFEFFLSCIHVLINL